MPYYVYLIVVKGKEITDKIYAQNLEDFLSQIYNNYEDFSYLHLLKVVE